MCDAIPLCEQKYRFLIQRFLWIQAIVSLDWCITLTFPSDVNDKKAIVAGHIMVQILLFFFFLRDLQQSIAREPSAPSFPAVPAYQADPAGGNKPASSPVPTPAPRTMVVSEDNCVNQSRVIVTLLTYICSSKVLQDN